MKRVGLCVIVFAVALVLNPTVERQVDPLTKQERFALELEACQKAWASGTPDKCELYGKIEVVDSFPDVKIQKVDSFPDIKVKWVNSFPDSPGKWQKVDSFPDYKVQFVDSFPDYKVQFVDSFPGCD